MKFSFKVNIGDNEFTFTGDSETHTDFFKDVSFFSSLPKVGPGGETDLELVYRTTSQGHEYYSIVSKQAGMELHLGQSQKNKGELYVKEWKPLYNAEASQTNTPAKKAPAAKPKTTSKVASKAAPKPASPPMPTAPPTPKVAPVPTPAGGPPTEMSTSVEASPEVAGQVDDIMNDFLGLN